MLNHLTVKNFAIADVIEVDFSQGMTVLSGETGAGKSIILDALGLTLGDRADTSMVRHGESKAEISAVFDIAAHPEALQWLRDHDLDDGEQCILRRVITAEGRSRGYINGQPAPLQDLKALGERLIDIHSQHEHQSLLQRDNHRRIVDSYGQLNELAQQVASAYRAWSEKSQQLEQLSSNQDELAARAQLLGFQVEELNNLALKEGEVAQLEQEQSRLANAEQLLQQTHAALQVCSEGEENIETFLAHGISSLQNLPGEEHLLQEALGLLNEAQIQVNEASSNLRQFMDSFELDPERLGWVEDRLSAVYQLARKHRCQPEELSEVHFRLDQELTQLTGGDQNLEQLAQEVERLKHNFMELAREQRSRRKQAAETFTQQVIAQLASMDMNTIGLVVQFDALEETSVNQHGLDRLEFLISTNPGQPPKPLQKVASGGELSRISLAIQVVIAKSSTIPTLVFDEVDVGIGGGTAQIVGRLLRKLGEQGQVICVTHLPQVASQGHQHLFISKHIENDAVRSAIKRLDEGARTQEIARMLGGIDITDQSLAHAKEMLTQD